MPGWKRRLILNYKAPRKVKHTLWKSLGFFFFFSLSSITLFSHYSSKKVKKKWTNVFNKFIMKLWIYWIKLKVPWLIFKTSGEHDSQFPWEDPSLADLLLEACSFRSYELVSLKGEACGSWRQGLLGIKESGLAPIIRGNKKDHKSHCLQNNVYGSLFQLRFSKAAAKNTQEKRTKAKHERKKKIYKGREEKTTWFCPQLLAESRKRITCLLFFYCEFSDNMLWAVLPVGMDNFIRL